MKELTEPQVEQALREAQEFFKEQAGNDEATLLDTFVGTDEYRRLVACPQERLAAFIDGRVPAKERRQIEAHLKVCPFCREEVAETRALVAAWRPVSVPVVRLEEVKEALVRSARGWLKDMVLIPVYDERGEQEGAEGTAPLEPMVAAMPATLLDSEGNVIDAVQVQPVQPMKIDDNNDLHLSLEVNDERCRKGYTAILTLPTEEVEVEIGRLPVQEGRAEGVIHLGTLRPGPGVLLPEALGITLIPEAPRAVPGV